MTKHDEVVTKPVKTRGARRLDDLAIENRWWAYELYVNEDLSGSEVEAILGIPRMTCVTWALDIARGIEIALKLEEAA